MAGKKSNKKKKNSKKKLKNLTTTIQHDYFGKIEFKQPSMEAWKDIILFLFNHYISVEDEEIVFDVPTPEEIEEDIDLLGFLMNHTLKQISTLNLNRAKYRRIFLNDVDLIVKVKNQLFKVLLEAIEVEIGLLNKFKEEKVDIKDIVNRVDKLKEEDLIFMRDYRLEEEQEEDSTKEE